MNELSNKQMMELYKIIDCNTMDVWDTIQYLYHRGYSQAMYDLADAELIAKKISVEKEKNV